MRKTLYILILLTLIATPASYGQTVHETLREGTATNDAAIIRQWLYQPIRYYSRSGHHYITIPSNAYNSVDKILLNTNIVVKDMRVLDNTLYFCGSHNNSGFVGTINLPLNPAFTMVGIFDTYFEREDISILTKMVVFKDQQDVKVVALGNSDTATHNDKIILECTFRNNNPTFTQIIKPYSNTSPEYLSDVILTDNYVAFVGTIAGNDGFVIHTCPRSSDIYSGYGQCYFYPYSESVAISGYIGTSLESDKVAVAACTGNRATDNMEIQIHTIDLASMSMLSSQSIPFGQNKADLIDMVYLPEIESIILLTPFQFASQTALYNTFLEIKPSPSANYSATGIFDTQLPYRSTDIASPTSFFGAARSTWFRHRPSAASESSPCYSLDITPVTVQETLSPINRLHIPNQHTPTYHNGIGLCLIENNIITISCTE